MKLDWLALWDELYASIHEGKTSWGKNDLMDHMVKLEKAAIRKGVKDAIQKT